MRWNTTMQGPTPDELGLPPYLYVEYKVRRVYLL
jgi:hypothetical protein